MDARHRPEAPGHVPGASSWARRFNQNTVDWLAAYCRLAALGWSVAAGVMLLGLAFTLGPSWLAAAVVSIGSTAAHAWLGFFYLANPEWKESDRE